MNWVATSFALLSTVVGTTQQTPQFAQEIVAHKITESLYVLEGAGGNVAAYIWEEGVLLVDDKIAPASPRLKAAVAKLTPKPIRFVINTHWHPDHRGGNAALAGEGAVIVAHENVRRRMSVDGFVAVFGTPQKASLPQALPIVTFTRDVTLHLGDEEISVVHVDPAHTDGDSFVRFRKANALHLGDCYLKDSYPVIDYNNGGSYPGTIQAADTAIGMADAGTRIIPGHGAVSDERELGEWRDMLAAILERVKALAAEGKTLEQVKAAVSTKEWDAKTPRSFVTAEHAIEEAYRAATSTPAR
jgi:cyclase